MCEMLHGLTINNDIMYEAGLRLTPAKQPNDWYDLSFDWHERVIPAKYDWHISYFHFRSSTLLEFIKYLVLDPYPTLFFPFMSYPCYNIQRVYYLICQVLMRQSLMPILMSGRTHCVYIMSCYTPSKFNRVNTLQYEK